MDLAIRFGPVSSKNSNPRLGQCDQKGRAQMIWERLLAYVTGTVDQELLLRNEYLAAENRVPESPDLGRLLFWADIGG